MNLFGQFKGASAVPFLELTGSDEPREQALWAFEGETDPSLNFCPLKCARPARYMMRPVEP